MAGKLEKKRRKCDSAVTSKLLANLKTKVCSILLCFLENLIYGVIVYLYNYFSVW